MENEKSSIKIVDAGITGISSDAIVNAANTSLQMGGGVCGVIFKKAGATELQKACDEIKHCDEGSAAITSAFGCPARISSTRIRVTKSTSVLPFPPTQKLTVRGKRNSMWETRCLRKKEA